MNEKRALVCAKELVVSRYGCQSRKPGASKERFAFFRRAYMPLANLVSKIFDGLHDNLASDALITAEQLFFSRLLVDHALLISFFVLVFFLVCGTLGVGFY